MFWCTSVLIKLQPCSAQPAIIPKVVLTLDLSEKALKVFDIFTGTHLPMGSFFFVRLPVWSCQNGLRHRGFLAWFLENNSSKFGKIVCEMSLLFLF